MTVYVLIDNEERGYDVFIEVFSCVRTLINFLNENEIEYFEEDDNEEEDYKIKDFTGMSVDSINEFFENIGHSFEVIETDLI